MTALQHYVRKYTNISVINTGGTFDIGGVDIPVYESPFVPPNRAYLANSMVMVHSIDQILWRLVLEDVRKEARDIVRWGLSSVLARAGEIPPEEVPCGCASVDGYPNYLDPTAHYVDDHKGDCNGWTMDGPPCGGCYRCIAIQARYYASPK